MTRPESARKSALEASREMEPVQGTVEVDVPTPVLWGTFAHANWWPRWNKCFFWVHNRELVAGSKLLWVFQPIKWWYFYKMFAIANIVELEKERKVTWEVTALPGFYARHTYHMEDLGNGRSRFGSWEQGMGAQIRFALSHRFWIAHFTFVKERSLEGALELERIYRRDGRISEPALSSRHRALSIAALALLLILLLAGIVATSFYRSYVKLVTVPLGSGITAVLGGGGNSLLLRDGPDLLLVDTKFPPGSRLLRRLIRKRIGAPVTIVVNTHYHYDHTQGNTEYPAAKKIAFRTTPGLMMARDGDWWRRHRDAMPSTLVGERSTLRVGSQLVMLVHPGDAHTRSDLYVYIKRDDRVYVATGDIVFNRYYPMMDLGEGGMDLPGLIRAVRELATQYPDAVFIPGHGPIADRADLLRYAQYLTFLSDQVAQARTRGLGEAGAVKAIELTSFGLMDLPTFHDNHLCWSNPEMNIRWVYQLEAGTREARQSCTF